MINCRQKLSSTFFFILRLVTSNILLHMSLISLSRKPSYHQHTLHYPRPTEHSLYKGKLYADQFVNLNVHLIVPSLSTRYRICTGLVETTQSIANKTRHSGNIYTNTMNSVSPSCHSLQTTSRPLIPERHTAPCSSIPSVTWLDLYLNKLHKRTSSPPIWPSGELQTVPS
jgi:hypothetical protein